MTPDTPIRIKDGPEISYADYQKKWRQGHGMKKGSFHQLGPWLRGTNRTSQQGEVSTSQELYNDLKSRLASYMRPLN